MYLVLSIKPQENCCYSMIISPYELISENFTPPGNLNLLK